MRRGPIPPGKAGLLVLAAAMAPLVIRKLRPLTRALGKGFKDLGKKLEDEAEAPHQDARTERERYESQFTAHQKVRRESEMKKDEQRVHEEDVPPVESASPTGQNEVEARLAEDVVANSTPTSKGKKVPKRPQKGANAGETNSKKDRPESPGKSS